jgi:hypothetical protein
MRIIGEVIDDNLKYAFAYYAKASTLIKMEKFIESEEYLGIALNYDESFDNNPYFNYVRVMILWSMNNTNQVIDILMNKFRSTDYIYSESRKLLTELVNETVSKINKLKSLFGGESDEMESLFDMENGGDFKSNAKKRLFVSIIFYKNHDNSIADMYIYSKNMNTSQKYIGNLILNDTDTEINIPMKKDLKTVEDYEKAINEFYDLKGEKYFDEYNGDFWQILETRPFIMWLLDYSTLLWEEKIDKEKSIELLEYLMNLTK